MHDFAYSDGVLKCEGMPVQEIARNNPTPFYLYSYHTLVEHYRKLKAAFAEMDPLICFSMKSSSNLSICRALVNEGAGLDIVSGGELFRALKAGCPPEKIVYASVGKKEEEIAEAIKKKINLFNVESVPELIMIDTVAKKLNKKARVAVRVNPDVKADTHEYITTGTSENKFGIDLKTAEDIFDNANKYSNVELKGVHVHIGSQITDPAPFVDAISKVLEFVDERSISIEWINIGGGLGIVYSDEKATTGDEFASYILPLLRGRGLKLILEPGRFIAGNAGILVCKVLYVKTGATGKKFIIVDAGMNDLLRPSLYEAYHRIVPLVERKAEPRRYDVVGPVCESGDYLALDRDLPEVVPGEYLAVMGAGAYGFVMASNYNSRPRPAELMAYKGEVRTIRAAESYKDLIRGEKILKELK
ncbi:MAG: diaminopimelate decarboxylase [Candidatus Omnitrophica bacterium]|nr:diaminopimelate decarboxylase [Candidatus Omnitrophota bacterium]